MIALLLQLYPILILIGGGLIWIAKLAWDITQLKAELKTLKNEQEEQKTRNGSVLADIRERLVRIETLLEKR